MVPQVSVVPQVSTGASGVHGCLRQERARSRESSHFLPHAIAANSPSPTAHPMSLFRAKKLDLGCYVNNKVIRDHTKRTVFAKNELERCAAPPPPPYTPLTHSQPPSQALRYIVANTSLPQRTRIQAQLQLGQMHCDTRRTEIRNRCIMGGKGRGILGDFRMSRVCAWERWEESEGEDTQADG